MDRWSIDKAKAWWADTGWVCGFNFLPSTAVNFLEMWHRDTFDRATIERELGWASGLGFNSLRVNLHYLVWKHDSDGLIERLEWLMATADSLGLRTVPCFFDDCGFGGIEPLYGPQPDPVPGVHNSRAVASPGRAALLNGTDWDGYERYVREIIRSFQADPRVLFWDIYNEPGNRMIFRANGSETYEPDFSAQSLALMRDSFAWARAEDPYQPLAVAAWVTPVPGSTGNPYQTTIDQAALLLSDIVTFHAYLDNANVQRFISYLDNMNRPMLCTEWMARPVGSKIDDQLAMFQSSNVGCFQWGLVKGRTQTNLPWPADLVAQHGGVADRSVWFHDMFDETGRAYDPKEAAFLKHVLSSPDP
ncbi:MAG: 1,4-beta-xylanase [Silicimonas sp.]|nr:1,4-beta-xylanase [Silicimonas sp.]